MSLPLTASIRANSPAHQSDLWQMVIKTAARKRFSEQNFLRRQCAEDLAISSMHAPRTELAYDLIDDLSSQLSLNDPEWEKVEEIIILADQAVGGPERWTQQTLAAMVQGDPSDEPGSMDLLSDVELEYSKSRMLSPTFELWLSRKLVSAEGHAYAQLYAYPIRAKSVGFWWALSKSAFKWIVGVIAAVGIGNSFG